MNLRSAMPSGALAVVAALALAACVPNNAEESQGIAVISTSDKCTVATTEVPAGPVVFHVTNNGDDVTEFYLLAEDGVRVVSELENIGPGISRDLVVRLAEGAYVTACKPGMVGDGIRAPFTVTAGDADVEPSGDRDAQLKSAADQYVLYVREEVETLVAKTDEFVNAYQAGDYDKARTLYADARVHWERVEPVAESFGDLDPKTDAREADVAEGEEWTGWHAIEKDLWPPAEGSGFTDSQRLALADGLRANIATLSTEVTAEDFTLDASQIGNGAQALLEEVAAGKVTGEEEIWSHTDLWDFQANVDGAATAFTVLRDVVSESDPDLVHELDTRFADLNDLLAQYGSIEDGFVLYTTLTPEQTRELSNAVDALSEPLSQLTAAAVL